jgi:hypothetical protein
VELSDAELNHMSDLWPPFGLVRDALRVGDEVPVLEQRRSQHERGWIQALRPSLCFDDSHGLDRCPSSRVTDSSESRGKHLAACGVERDLEHSLVAEYILSYHG